MNLDVIAQSPLFRGIDRDTIAQLLNGTTFQLKKYKKGEVIALAGDRVERAMILLEGRLKGEMVDLAGNNLKIEELHPPQMVASAFLYGPNSFFPVDLSALENSKILIIQKSDFTKILSLDTRLLNNFLNIISGKVQFLSEKITILSLKTIREKIAYFLLSKSKGESDSIKLNMNQKSISEIFGIARQSLVRTIREMEAKRLIRWNRTEVLILNRQMLKQCLGK